MTDSPESRLMEQARLLDADSAGALRDLRKAGRDSFSAQGFPTGRMEEWRVTDITPVRNAELQAADRNAPMPAPQHLSGAWWRQVLDATPAITTLNGHVLDKGPLPPCIRVAILTDRGPSDAPADTDLGTVAELQDAPFAALNTAFLTEAVSVSADPGADGVPVLHIAHRSAGADSVPHNHPRIFVRVRPHAALRLIESTCGEADRPYLVNTVTEIVLEEGASLDHVRIQDDARAAFHFGSVFVRQAANSRYASYALNLGAALARNEFLVSLDGEGAECLLNGLYTGRADQLLDTHSVIRHAVPHGTSSELYKGIMDGNSRGVFRGLIHVLPHAVKTSAYQSSRALLLSDTAKVHAKPQLLIFNDDVKCSHGATVGALDPDALFFLQSRGLSASRARGMLTAAFGAEPFKSLDFPELTEQLTEQLRERYA